MNGITNIVHQLAQRKVGIAGAGGLGSNVALALARSGVGSLVVADNDVVTTGNLNRQYYFTSQLGKAKTVALQENIRNAAPHCRVEGHCVRVTPSNAATLFGICDVVVEAFDQATEKEWFISFMTATFPQKPLVAASGMAGWGRFQTLSIQQSGTLYLCGDQQEAVSLDCPALAPRVGIVAMMQANQVLDLLLTQS